MDLCQAKRGVLIKDMKYMDANRVDLHYEMPLGEIVYDFFDAHQIPHAAAMPASTMS